MIKYTPKIIIVMLVILLTACFSSSTEESNQPSQENLEGQILLWHTWEGKERETLQAILSDFIELHPNVTIIEESFPIDDIEERFNNQVGAGLGPDLLIAPANWAERLAKRQLIRDIGQYNIDLDVYLTTALAMLKNEDTLYGLPLSLNTFALYYNKTLLGPPPTLELTENTEDKLAEIIANKQQLITNTETLAVLDELAAQVEQTQPQVETFVPPADLETLLYQVNLGQNAAIRTDFYGAFWGIQTFGGQLFDEEGRIVLNQGGFANWLGWLKKAQENPNIILNRNVDELSLLFTSGKVTYYVGSSEELSNLQEALGEDVVGVVRLPGRQIKQAGPFLQTEALMFSRVSATKNLNLSLQLAEYLTNVEQQRKLALSVGKLPANKRVKIDTRVSPIVAEFVAQSKTAVSVNLNDINKFNDVISSGDKLYAQVLEGELDVGEAATLLTEEVNQKYNLETIASSQSGTCEVQGNITLWNTWKEENREALITIQDNFLKLCPNVLITIKDVDPVEFSTLYAEAVEVNQTPTIFTGNNQQITQLAKEELILNINDLLDSEFLQRFIPLVEQSVLYQGNIYAVPTNVNVMALYYNSSLINDPPVVLNDLLAVATPDTKVALPINFKDSYWGISAFNAEGETVRFFDEENRLIIGNLGLIDWLDWLKTAQNQSGMVLSADRNSLQTLFIEEEAAFLVGNVSQLKTLQTALGVDKVGVVPLPSGSPLLNVDVLFVSPFTNPEEREVAIKFAQFITDGESQNILLEQASRVPVNINVSTVDYPAINGFVEQTNNATMIPNISQVDAVFNLGDVVYKQVLENEIAPSDAVNEFTQLVDATNGFEVVEADVAIDCVGEGQISLWHSWTDVEQLAWQQVISDFVEICPTVEISTTYVAADEFTLQLTTTLEADSNLVPPDFFVASHAQLQTYHNGELIKNITSLVKEEQLLGYLPESVTAFSLNDALYAIPQTLDVPVLYYHPDLVKDPAQTFENLLVQASEGLTVAINTQFYDVFWGATAFGCQPCQTAQFVDETGELLLSNADLADWQAWLESAAATKQFVFSTDQTTLETLFLEKKVAYLVAGPDFLNEAQSTLGVANVGLLTLPYGEALDEEEQVSKPFIEVNGFYFYSNTTEEKTNLALQFARFATLETNQTLLMQVANFVPISELASVTADDTAMITFITQGNAGVLLPPQNKRTILESDSVFRMFDDLTTP